MILRCEHLITQAARLFHSLVNENSLETPNLKKFLIDIWNWNTIYLCLATSTVSLPVLIHENCVCSCSCALRDPAGFYSSGSELKFKAGLSGWVHPWECGVSAYAGFYLHNLLSDCCGKQHTPAFSFTSFILHVLFLCRWLLSWLRRSGASSTPPALTSTGPPAWPPRWSDSTLCCRRRLASQSSGR